MLYRTHVPGPPLSRFVEMFWYGENVPRHLFERFLPNGDVDLVINLQDATFLLHDDVSRRHTRRLTGPIVSGIHSRYYVVDTGQQASLIGVKFRPGGAHPFLHDSADRLQNLQLGLDDLWGAAAVELQERLMDAKTMEARFQCLEAALRARLSSTARTHPAVAHAASLFLASHGTSPISGAAAAVSLSPRRFIELFRREVGVAPKLYCRILRFRRALHEMPAHGGMELSRVALRCGYYDQAHFIRDFREFTGITPTAYRAARGSFDDQLPMAE